MERVATILENDPLPRVAAVLSACRGVTDALLTLVSAAERQEDGDAERLDAIRRRHIGIATALLTPAAADAYVEELTANCREIAGILQTVRLIRFASPVVRDLVAGFGEIWSTRLFARYLQARGKRAGEVHWIDAREIVADRPGAARPERPLAGIARQRRSDHYPRAERHADHHRLHRPHARGPADHAGPQRQRLLGVDFRRRCSTHPKSSSGPTWTAC